MLVALDTNAMIAVDWRNPQFDGFYVEALLAFLRNTGGRLLISDVVLQEYAEYARNELYSKKLARILSAFDDPHVRGALGLQSVPRLPSDGLLDRIMDSWRRTLESRIGDVMTLLPHDNAMLEEALRRAIVKGRPVVERDAGFKDAVIWLSILDHAERSALGALIALISNDKGFREDGDEEGEGPLNSELVAECGQRGLEVRRYATIQRFVEENVENVKAEFAWLALRLKQADLTSVISTYYVLRGPLAPLKELEPFSENQVRAGVPTITWFGIDNLKETYVLTRTDSATTLALVLEVSGEIVSNTYDRRIRGDHLAPGEVPEPDERHRFKPMPTLPVILEIKGDFIRVLRAGDWEPPWESDEDWLPRVDPGSTTQTQGE